MSQSNKPLRLDQIFLHSQDNLLGKSVIHLLINQLNFTIMASRRPTFSETKRVLYTLLSVFEPSSHALQALAPAKAAAAKPSKLSLKKEEAVSPVEPMQPPPKVSKGRVAAVNSVQWPVACHSRGIAGCSKSCVLLHDNPLALLPLFLTHAAQAPASPVCSAS